MTLLEEIQAKCPQALIDAKEHGQIAALVSEGRTAVMTRILSARGVLERHPGGPLAADAVMTKLEAYAASNGALSSVTKRALSFLAMEAGLDFGSAATRTMIDTLAAYAVITADEAAALKGLGVLPAPVSVAEVVTALGA